MRGEFDDDPPPPPGHSPLFQAVVVYGGLALIFAITLLVEAHLAERELRGLEQQVLQMAAFSGAPLDRPEALLEGVKAEAARIRDHFGVEVHYLYTPNRYFPKSWRDGPGYAKAAQLPLDELERMLPFVWEFLARYPEHLIRENLSDIYLSSQLSFFQKDYGGTYSGSSIYLSGASVEYPFHDLHVRGGFHHEFSSILMYRYGFPFETWRAVNEPDFVYPDNALEMLESDEGNAFNEALLAGGFLRGYATSTLENDINVMAEWLFTRPDELRDLAESHDRIAGKMRIARDFYQSVDPAISIR